MERQGYSGWSTEETWRANMEYLNPDEITACVAEEIEKRSQGHDPLDRPETVARHVFGEVFEETEGRIKSNLEVAGCPDMERVNAGEIAECFMMDVTLVTITVRGFRGSTDDGPDVMDEMTVHKAGDAVSDRIREIVEGSMGCPGIEAEFPEVLEKISKAKKGKDIKIVMEYEEGEPAIIDVSTWSWRRNYK